MIWKYGLSAEKDESKDFHLLLFLKILLFHSEIGRCELQTL